MLITRFETNFAHSGYVKVAFHVHSDWSYDGRLSLEAIAELFARRGYDAVMLCEHCRTFDDARWRDYQQTCRAVQHGAKLIPGIEYSDPDNVVHLPTWGLDDFAGVEVPSVQVIDRVREQRAVCIFAHPARKNAWSQLDFSWIDALSGYELWNRKADGFAPSRLITTLRQTDLPAFAALDFHSDRQRAPFVMQVPCCCDEAEILDAIRKRKVSHYVAGIPLDLLRRSCLRRPLSVLEMAKRAVTQCRRESNQA